jgi:tetratricopeptide (TPR) repeat protein
MDPELITPKAIEKALDLMQQAERLDRSPLLQLEVVRQRLEAEGRPANRATLEVALGQLLAELVNRELETVRHLEGFAEPRPRMLGSRMLEENQLRQDFARGNAYLEMWSCLYYRYLRPDLDLRLQDFETVAHVNIRTIKRRLERGVKQLAANLREMEINAENNAGVLRMLRRLPAPTYTHLFGVEDRLERMRDALQDRSGRWLIALEGLGGLGKTASTRAMAEWVARQGLVADLAWITAKQETFSWEEIRTSSRPALTLERLAEELAAQLGYPDIARMSHAEQWTSLCQIVKSRPYLIVVDNLETVADYEALASALWELANPSKILLTSRHRLTRYEFVYSVPCDGLDETAALALIRDEGEKRGVRDVLTAEAGVLRLVYEVTGGNPLAIKLALGQAVGLPLERVVASLREARGHQSDQLYTYLYRHSWQLLSPGARRTLLCLPHLPGSGTTWSDIEAIADLPPEELADAIKELSDRSLIAVGGFEQKVYSLHELTRQFLASELRHDWQRGTADDSSGGEPGPFRQSARRAGEHWLAYIEQHRADPHALERKRDHVLQALSSCYRYAEAWDLVVRLALAFHDHMERRGFWESWEGYLALALQSALRLSDERAQAALLDCLGSTRTERGYWDEGLQLHEQALAIWERVDSPADMARTLNAIGRLQLDRGGPDLALDFHRRAAFIYTRLHDNYGLAITLNNVGRIYVRRGQNDAALACYLEAEGYLRATNAETDLARVLNNLGYVYSNRAEYDKSLAYFQEAIQYATRVEARSFVSAILMNIGTVYQARWQWAQALEHYQKSLDIALEQGDLHRVAQNAGNMGATYVEMHQWDKALPHLAKSVEIAERLGDQATAGEALTIMGQASAELGDWEQARTLLGRAVEILERIGERPLLVTTLNRLGELHSRMGNWDRAVAYYEDALTLAAYIGDRRAVGQGYYYLSKCHQVQNNLTEAQIAGEKALAEFEAIGAPEVDEVKRWLDNLRQ